MMIYLVLSQRTDGHILSIHAYLDENQANRRKADLEAHATPICTISMIPVTIEDSHDYLMSWMREAKA